MLRWDSHDFWRSDPGNGRGRLAGRLGAKDNPRALFVLPGLGMIAAIPFALVAIYGHSVPWILADCSSPRARSS